MKEFYSLEEIKHKIDHMKTMDEESKNILNSLLACINHMGKDIEDLKEQLSETLEYAELLEQDMDNIKEEMFGEEIFTNFEEEEDYTYVEVKCNNCGENIYVENDLMKEHLICPNCENSLF